MSQATHRVTPLFGTEKPFDATVTEVKAMEGKIARFAEHYTVAEITKPAKPAEPADTTAESKTKAAADKKGSEKAE